MCKSLGTKPDPEQTPPEFDDFTEDFQLCFTILNYMSEKWDSMAGVYMGRDFTELPYLLELFEVEECIKLEYLGIMKYINQETMQITNSKLEQQRKSSKHGK